MPTWTPTLFAALVLLVGCGDDDPAPAPPVDTLLDTIPEGVETTAIAWSPVGPSVAYRVWVGEKHVLRVNGREGKPYDLVLPPIAAPDGRFAFGAVQGEAAHIVVGEWESEGYEKVSPLIRFSADGKRWAAEVMRDGKWYLLVDGKVEGEGYDEIEAVAFGGKGTAFTAGVGGEEGGLGMRGGKWFVVHGGKRGPEVDGVGAPVFSPDGSTLAYAVTEGGSRSRIGGQISGGACRVIVGERRGPEFDGIGDPVFSADGKTVAYVAQRGGKTRVVEGEKEGPEVDAVSDLVALPDGRGFHYTVRSGAEAYVMSAGEKHESFESIQPPAFSADGRHVAYAAQAKGGGWHIVIDGKKGAEIDAAAIAAVALSPDGAKVAYAAWNKSELWVAVGDRKSGTFTGGDGVPTFSADGKSVGFGVQKGRELWWMTMAAE